MKSYIAVVFDVDNGGDAACEDWNSLCARGNPALLIGRPDKPPIVIVEIEHTRGATIPGAIAHWAVSGPIEALFDLYCNGTLESVAQEDDDASTPA